MPVPTTVGRDLETLDTLPNVKGQGRLRRHTSVDPMSQLKRPNAEWLVVCLIYETRRCQREGRCVVTASEPIASPSARLAERTRCRTPTLHSNRTLSLPCSNASMNA